MDLWRTLKKVVQENAKGAAYQKWLLIKNLNKDNNNNNNNNNPR